MELTLNIYKKGGREIEKTYRTTDFDIMFGALDDVIKLVDVDSLVKGMESDDKESVNAFIATVAKLISGAFTEVKALLKEAFPEVTDEELRRVKVKELVPLILDIAKMAGLGFGSLGSKKN